MVASFSSLVSSYLVSSTDIVAQALGYVYPRKVDRNLVFSKDPFHTKLAALVGTIASMVLSGYFTDRIGRQTFSGLDLAIIIMGTIGMATSSAGYDNSMDIHAWVQFWHFIVGCGIGLQVCADRVFQESSATYNPSSIISQYSPLPRLPHPPLDTAWWPRRFS